MVASLKAISRSRGSASQWSLFSANIYRGCPHGCKYCFVPIFIRQSTSRFMTSRDIYSKVNLENIRHDLRKIPIKEPPIHLCVLCDPYPKGWDSTRTRIILQAIRKWGSHFQILTKNGLEAVRDFDLYSRGDWFGVTLTCDNKVNSAEWEPGAPPPYERIEAIRLARELWDDISIWASFEPVLDPKQTLRLIEIAAEFVDFIFIGKLNTFGNPMYPIEVQRLEHEIDWAKFGSEAAELCENLDLQFEIKEELGRRVPVSKLRKNYFERLPSIIASNLDI